ncbi:MAG: RNA 3'-terminal phosphate cyclase [Thermoproteota archaeon]|jgi:RNA 3'-phosphate cyclase|nr:RNA 3'-terminal phosphate cyclase [Thermoproteota archaeon]
MIKIDGSFGEGGGQILRTAIALSAITGKPIHIYNIRAKRDKPGLRPQHLTAVKAIAEICNAKVEGLKIESKEITFIPGNILAKNYEFNIGTAGSVTLVLQALLPVLNFAERPIFIRLIGGTEVPKSPTFSYFKNVLLHYLSKMGLHVDVNLIKHGFYPKGGGILEVNLEPSKLNALTYEKFGEIKEVYCEAYSEGLPEHVVMREINECLRILTSHNISSKIIKVNQKSLRLEESKGNIGNFFFIMSKSITDAIIGYDSIGLKGIPAEKVSREPTQILLENIFNTNAPLDMFAGDQILIWASIAKGKTVVKTHKFTLHAFTTLHILKEILEVNYTVEGKLHEPARIIIEGKGI